MARRKLSDVERSARDSKRAQVQAERQARRAIKAAEGQRKKQEMAQRLSAILKVEALTWPSDVARTPSEKRQKPRFRRIDMEKTFMSLRKTAVGMDLDYVTVQWAVQRDNPECVLDETFVEPGIVLLYGANAGTPDVWHRRLPMDRWSTAAGNLRAAISGLRGMGQILRAGIVEWVQSLDTIMLSTVVLPSAPPSKANMPVRNIIEALRVLEIHDDANLTVKEVRAQVKDLLRRYHPDLMGGDDSSTQVILKAADFLYHKLEPHILTPHASPVSPRVPPTGSAITDQRVMDIAQRSEKRERERQEQKKQAREEAERFSATRNIVTSRNLKRDAVDEEVDRVLR